MEENKNDQAKLPETPSESPACGNNNDQKIKLSSAKIALVIVGVAILLGVLAAVIFLGMDRSPAPAVETTEVSETEAPATIPADGNPDDETAKGTYTASDEDVIAAHDTVVARMGGNTLTNGQLQMFYWTEVRNFLSSYGSYASYVGLDPTKPLDVQTCAIADTQCTWQQFFLASALNSWRNYQATAAEAESAGFQLDEETQSQLDAAIENLEQSAPLYGFENAEELLKDDVGVGATLDDYSHFLKLYYTGSVYFSDLCQTQEPTDEEVEKYFDDNAEAYEKNGLTKDNILTEGASLSYPDSVIDFFKGMMGQPEGGFPKELQKIVLKDIEPITVRPGTLLPDVDFEDIKHHLREKFDMKGFSDFEMEQKAVSYALYPKVYEDYCTHFEAYNDVTTLESHVYFYGLRKGEETVLKASEGRDILIKFVGMSDPDKEGYRVLTFEVNGILRELKVLDKTLEVLEDRKLKADKNNPCHLGSTIPGTVETVLVKEGDEVKVNQPLMIVEAMKMETTFVSKVNGKVDKLYVAPGDRVNTEDLLVSFILDEEE